MFGETSQRKYELPESDCCCLRLQSGVVTSVRAVTALWCVGGITSNHMIHIITMLMSGWDVNLVLLSDCPSHSHISSFYTLMEPDTSVCLDLSPLQRT